LPEINIAVCGQPGVGKTSFIRSVLDLPELPAYKSAERRFSFGDTLYLLRLLEFSTDEIDTDEDGFIEWPDTIEDRAMPRVHGALSLYDVQDKSSIQELRDILSPCIAHPFGT
jgi:GTPase SAR1 family protein